MRMANATTSQPVREAFTLLMCTLLNYATAAGHDVAATVLKLKAVSSMLASLRHSQSPLLPAVVLRTLRRTIVRNQALPSHTKRLVSEACRTWCPLSHDSRTCPPHPLATPQAFDTLCLQSAVELYAADTVRITKPLHGFMVELCTGACHADAPGYAAEDSSSWCVFAAQPSLSKRRRAAAEQPAMRAALRFITTMLQVCVCLNVPVHTH